MSEQDQTEQDQTTVADRFESYLLGQLDDAVMDQLEDELRQSPEHADDCVAVMATLAMVREQFREQHQQAGELTKDPTLHSFHDLLSELSAMEAAADAQAVQWVGQLTDTRRIWQKWSILIPAATAALLAIAVVLIVSLPSGNTATNSPPLAVHLSDPPEPGPIDPVPARIVATLTAESEAQWAEGVFSPGTPLKAGQRLTLVQGFAEITTARGAVAIVEAPAAIQFLKSPNALQLNMGKLVGICETESSKGFLVRTKTMDVIDLGTMFGVNVTRDQITATVFTGSVDVAPITGSPKRLVANQTAQMSTADPRHRLVIEHRLAEGFSTRMSKPALVTAVYINDDRFKVGVVPGGALEDARVLTDRSHEINGVDARGLPEFLIGGDIILTPADARPRFNKDTQTLRIDADFSSPAQVYLITRPSGQQRVYPDWLEREYTKTEFRVGLDHGPFSLKPRLEVGVGPGESIDEVMEVWRRNQPASGRATVGREMSEHVPYILIAVPAQQAIHR
ncbi:MAG: hypothetical protein AAGI37_01365 [Planctomycetota bacterium]